MISRRAFVGSLTGGLLAAPLIGGCRQQARKVYHVGFLSAGLSSEFSQQGTPVQSFLEGLRDLGYVEGRSLVMEYRVAEGHPDRLPELAADLVRAHVDVIVTAGTPATYAAMQATKSIPIVAAAGSLVEKGIVASLARPGGSVTGVSFQNPPALKLYQLLKEAAPRVTRGIFLYDPDSSPRDTAERALSRANAANVEWQSVVLRDDPHGVTRAFAEFKPGTNGLVLDNSTSTILVADQICNLALQRHLPTIGLYGRFSKAGCLMSYSEDVQQMYRLAAGLVDKILKGAKPADLPVEQPTKFELVINLKTAKALGLTILPALLARADEVIQ